MYNRNIAILCLIVISFMIEVTAMVTILSLAIPSIEFSDSCLITFAPSILSSYW